jgi:lipid A 3-O-deacylase
LTRPRGLSAYVFIGASGRAVLRDVFLDGNTFRDSHDVDRNLLVGDLMAGVTVGYGGLKLSLAKVLRTSEFDGQPHDHRFGSITLSYAY